ncbi:hypothetical protein sos41_17240 [Alphaproteobacteria bacterium SO-S41]|nr:hypothetical protein sos41_17240 [Alphaproteobacteria bacterium SO-S41]
MTASLRSILGLSAGAIALASIASAATATADFNVKIQITSECLINSASDLDFGTTGVIATAIPGTSTLGIQCTSGTTYSVGISAGAGVGATVAARKMTGPSSQTVQYSLYRDAPHTLLWGVSIGSNTLAGTGNGANQIITVYGLVPVQTTSGVGSYTDTVTATVTY